MDLGNLRHRSPNDAADRSPQKGCSACISARPLVTAAPFVVAAGVMAEVGETVHGWWGDDGNKALFGGIGGREDAAAELISTRETRWETSTLAAKCFDT